MRTKLIVVLELLYGRVLKVFIEWVVICQWSIRVVDVFQLSPIVFEAFEKKRTQIRFICSAMEMALMILRSHRSIARWKPDFTSIFERVRGKTEVKYFCSFCLLHWKYGRQLFNSFWNFSIWISRYFAIKFAMIHWVIKSLTFYRSRIRKNLPSFWIECIKPQCSDCASRLRRRCPVMFQTNILVHEWKIVFFICVLGAVVRLGRSFLGFQLLHQIIYRRILLIPSFHWNPGIWRKLIILF